jgi:hypothetical protein
MGATMLTNARVLTAFAMLAIFAAMTALALGYPDKAALMPLIVGVPATVLAFVQLVIEIRKAAAESGRQSGAADDQKTREEHKRELDLFLWLFLFFAGILGFGFVYAAPVLVFAFLYFGRKESLTVGLVSGVATWAVLYGFFELWFELFLFEGLVVEWLLG